MIQKRYSKRYSALTSEASQKEKETLARKDESTIHPGTKEGEKDVRTVLEERMSCVKYIDVIALRYYIER